MNPARRFGLCSLCGEEEVYRRNCYQASDGRVTSGWVLATLEQQQQGKGPPTSRQPDTGTTCHRLEGFIGGLKCTDRLYGGREC